MIHNPLLDPLFAPTFALLGTILGLALLGLCLVERRHLRHPWRRTLFQRWFTWLLIGPAYALAILAGPLAALLLVSLLVFQGLREYGRMVGLPRLYRVVLLVMGVGVGPVALWSSTAYFALPPLLLLLGTLQPLLTQDVRSGTRHLAFAALGFAYLPWMLDHFLLIYAEIEGGPGILLALGAMVGFSDVGAFLVGRRFGRRKLAAVLSPNKTLAGLVGNVLGAYLGCLVLSFALPPQHRPLLLAALPPLVALGAVWGDLLESLIKREAGVKDTGAVLPGMGGILDRIDSLIVVLPLSYVFLRLAT